LVSTKFAISGAGARERVHRKVVASALSAHVGSVSAKMAAPAGMPSATCCGVTSAAVGARPPGNGGGSVGAGRRELGFADDPGVCEKLRISSNETQRTNFAGEMNHVSSGRIEAR
jgi:hypothetical protein